MALLMGLMALGCAVRRKTVIQPSAIPPPVLEATTASLLERVNAWGGSIQTLTATVDLEPTTGSVYSGVIKEYHDVKGFVLLEKPRLIRMMGQAPIIRTQIFDMASDGDEFRVYVAPKAAFIVGKTESRRPAKSALENLRPQHILDALLIPPVDAGRERYARAEEEDSGRRYYVVSVLELGAESELDLKRRVWFDRTNLDIARLQIYGPQGTFTEDVQYSGYKDFAGLRYPARIEIHRPVEDYRLTITIQKATFNQPIEREKFDLKKPQGAQLVDLTATAGKEAPRGQ